MAMGGIIERNRSQQGAEAIDLLAQRGPVERLRGFLQDPGSFGQCFTGLRLQAGAAGGVSRGCWRRRKKKKK